MKQLILTFTLVFGMMLAKAQVTLQHVEQVHPAIALVKAHRDTLNVAQTVDFQKSVKIRIDRNWQQAQALQVQRVFPFGNQTGLDAFFAIFNALAK